MTYLLEVSAMIRTGLMVRFCKNLRCNCYLKSIFVEELKMKGSISILYFYSTTFAWQF